MSVIIPAWNCAGFLRETLESVASQTCRDWEVVVVDDGSTDDTLATAEAAAAAIGGITVVRQANRGPSAARNAGVRAADPGSRYLLFLDADDVLEKDTLETLCAYMDAHPSVGLAHFDCTCIDAQGRPLGHDDADFSPMNQPRYVPCFFTARKLRSDEVETPFVSIYNLAGIIPSLAFVRRSVFEACGGWDDDFGQMFEDTDLWLRIALRSRVHYVPRPLVRYRRHAAQSTSVRRADQFSDRLSALLAKWSRVDELEDEEHRRVVRAAERFRLGGLAVYKNLRLSRRRLSSGDFVGTLRFGYGALRVLLGLNRNARNGEG